MVYYTKNEPDKHGDNDDLIYIENSIYNTAEFIHYSPPQNAPPNYNSQPDNACGLWASLFLFCSYYFCYDN